MALLGHIYSLSMRLLPTGILRGDSRGLFALPAVLVGLSLCLMLALCAPAEAQREAEINKLKAAFVYQFANFVEWPQDALDDKDDAFVICIVGNDDLADILKAAVRGKSVGDLPIRVETATDGNESSDCQIVFIDDSKSRDAEDMLSDMKERPILTVGDSDDFTKEGGIIRLYPQASKLRIEVNIDAAERAGIKISSKLLTVARVVRDDD